MGTSSEATDESLLAAYRDGDRAAFETLFRRYQAPLYRHLTRMLDDPAAAEDLVIETFERLHVHRDDFRTDGADSVVNGAHFLLLYRRSYITR